MHLNVSAVESHTSGILPACATDPRRLQQTSQAKQHCYTLYKRSIAQSYVVEAHNARQDAHSILFQSHVSISIE